MHKVLDKLNKYTTFPIKLAMVQSVGESFRDVDMNLNSQLPHPTTLSTLNISHGALDLLLIQSIPATLIEILILIRSPTLDKARNPVHPFCSLLLQSCWQDKRSCQLL